jgi:glycerol-3-phosphate dehydrogenase
MDSARLGPEERQRNLDRMADERFDVVVIGGGVTGCGAALDAASRGLSVALIEQRDLASGTSSRSSKLIHGGLRYLEQFDFKLVREALRERGLLLGTIAPHLVWPVPFIYPLQHRFWERFYVGAGITLYDAMASLGEDNPLPRHKHLSHRSLLKLFPALRPDRFVGGIRYFDAGTDDARFVVALARTAAAHGAAITTSTRAVGLVTGGKRVVAVEAQDMETGRKVVVRARVVVNASGVWTDDVENLAGERKPQVTASKGIHLVIPRERITAAAGLITKTEKSVLFIIPFQHDWLIGTTDTPWTLGKAHPAASRADIDYVLGHVNGLLEDPLHHEDVIGVYAGLRPLVTGDAQSTAKLSREHSITRPVPGLVSIAGGKYTTYRVMAEDVINEATSDFATPPPPTRTREIPLHGAIGWQRSGSGPDTGHLRRRHGSDTARIEALIAREPTLGKRIVSDAPYLQAEVVWAAQHEAALHLDDVLTRRTRISIEVADRGIAAAQVAAGLMAPIFGWDEAAVDRELRHYAARVQAERDSQEMPDDRTADAARLGAPDVRTLGD